MSVQPPRLLSFLSSPPTMSELRACTWASASGRLCAFAWLERVRLVCAGFGSASRDGQAAKSLMITCRAHFIALKAQVHDLA